VNFDDKGSDEQIAAAAKGGGRDAFEVLVRRHKADLYRFVRRYVGQGDDAYDILQDCFVSAWLSLDRYDPARPFLPWLRTIALNKCRDFARRQKVRRLILRAFAAETDRTEGSGHEMSPDPGDETRRLHRLDQAIRRLPAFYKEPLLLTTVSGLSHIEAAAELKTTPKAIEMRLYRARKKILADLGPDSERPEEG
jgi:RNA polymerase sigma-70 factor (ECF subfamily)